MDTFRANWNAVRGRQFANCWVTVRGIMDTFWSELERTGRHKARVQLRVQLLERQYQSSSPASSRWSCAAKRRLILKLIEMHSLKLREVDVRQRTTRTLDAGCARGAQPFAGCAGLGGWGAQPHSLECAGHVGRRVGGGFVLFSCAFTTSRTTLCAFTPVPNRTRTWIPST